MPVIPPNWVSTERIALKYASTMLQVGTIPKALVFPYSLFNFWILELGTGSHPKVGLELLPVTAA